MWSFWVLRAHSGAPRVGGIARDEANLRPHFNLGAINSQINWDRRGREQSIAAKEQPRSDLSFHTCCARLDEKLSLKSFDGNGLESKHQDNEIYNLLASRCGHVRIRLGLYFDLCSSIIHLFYTITPLRLFAHGSSG
jgi:hypothetical protein